MFLEIFLTSLLILTVLAINFCWIIPKRAMRYYENQLKAMKYRAKVVPCKPFYNRYLDVLLEGKKKGDPMNYYKSQFQNYDIVVSNVMNKPYIEIGHVDFLKAYFSFEKHYEYPKLPLLVDPLLNFFGKTMGLSEGQIWKQKRNVLNKVFTFDFIKNQAPNIVEICDRCMRQMEEKAKKGQDQSGKYVECHLLHDLLTNIFSAVMFTGFLGQKNRHEIDGIQVSKYLLNTIDDVGEHRLLSPTILLGNWFYDLKIRKIDKSINERKKIIREWGKNVINAELKNLQNQIKQKGSKIQIDNFIKAFVIYKKQNNLSDQSISEADIFNEFLGLIFAGTDSTSNFLNGMLMYIAKNPQVEKELRKQIEENLKDDYSYENLKKFKYIQALQKETSRIYGPGNILLVRQALNDNYLNGLAIKKGTLIAPISHGNHYSEKYFKEPHKFRPQRWLNGQCDNLDPFVTIGFSAGARTCIGKHLALLQSKIALIKIMKRYKKIKLGKEDFKWDIKFFACPEPFNTRLTIDSQSQ